MSSRVGRVAYEIAILSAVCVLILGGAAFWIRKLRARVAFLQNEFEAALDDIWEAEEREERARAEGRMALSEAEARAEAGARAKSKFLATVTHEMRTPLSGVIGTTDLLLDTPLAADQRTYAWAVKQSAEAMLALVDEILDFSRIEADRMVLNDAPFAVASLAEGVAELLAPRAQTKGLDLAVRIGADVPAELLGDAPRIRQILLNLAGNAIKFTEEGGVGLRVDASDEAVTFVVSDTGPGFEQSDAERLFGEFEQRATDHAAGGAGLGLAISRRLALAMGGTLTATAAPGAGATFTLELPLRPSGAPAAEQDAALIGRKVVVVSDAPFSGPWLAEQLNEWGADAAIVSSDSDLARSCAGAHTVIIDRTDARCAADLAAAARRGGVFRVLMLLAPSERRELPTLLADGFDGYLVKPVRAASLVSRLEDPRSEHATAPEPHHAMSFPSGSGLKILLAEDDPVSALIALAHISRLGHSATHVADGVAACTAFENGEFDAALLDIRMPRLDGCSAARRMREIEAERGGRAYLLAVTANVAPEDREAAAAAGMDGLLAKPLDKGELEALLAALAASGSKVA